jgi:hypothetical protein
VSRQLGVGIACVFGRDCIPRRPEIGVLTSEEGCDQIVLRAKVSIQARLRDSGLLDDEIDPDRVNSATIEEVGRRCQDAFSHA